MRSLTFISARIIKFFLWCLLFSLIPCSCQNIRESTLSLPNKALPLAETPFQPLSTATSIPTTIFSPTPIPLPEEVARQKIDGIETSPEYDAGLNNWVWRDKKGIIRRVLDSLSSHVLARTSNGNERLTYEIDYKFKWEVNLVNYQYYPTHAPFGTAYINLLKLKHPELFAQAHDQTGIIFRILQTELSELPSFIHPTTVLDEGTEKERFFLSPTYLPASNEYLFVMGLKTDFLTRKGAINTYTEEMLNYCISPINQGNPSGSWGIEVYKHAIK